MSKNTKIVLFGQSLFGAEVYQKLRDKGYQILAAYTIPDKNGKADIMAEAVEKDGIPVYKHQAWRKKIKPGEFELIQSRFEEYKTHGADLNVLAYVSQFIPMEVINHPSNSSICYHPSILPVHRGASAINWTLMSGDKKSGFTIFWPDDGLDTGPILLQKECNVTTNDNVTSLYNRFMFPQGVKGMIEAVDLIEAKKAPKIIQNEEGASYEPMWMKKENAKIKWDATAYEIHNLIRGSDKIPGAWTVINGEKITLSGSKYINSVAPVKGEEIQVEGCDYPAYVSKKGIYFVGKDQKKMLISMVELPNGKSIPASKFLSKDEVQPELVLTAAEEETKLKIVEGWKQVLQTDAIEGDTDFFGAGAGSMDVVKLIAITKAATQEELTPDEVYMNTEFNDFLRTVIKKMRGEPDNEVEFTPVQLEANGLQLSFPNQLFINGEFVDSKSKETFPAINPTNEEVICNFAKATVSDVEDAVEAAKDAFNEGPWKEMNARDRGNLMYKLAELMEQNKEELATLESLDSGAVYTLALKTHVGMSIDTFRYYAGFCDKIHGKTIPINNARPNHNLCYTKIEPIGPCGIVIPWNYPLMMLAWKMGACLAAGNTIVLKPAQATSLTAMKFAELVVKAGFPPGVINIVTGSGAVVGEAIATHDDIRKIGFTGSTGIGKQIMGYAAATNLKKCSLELGGKSPLIIFEDCDLDKAVKNACQAVFFNKGENCIAAGRIFVEEDIHDEFIRRCVEETKKMVIGDPLNVDTSHGPQNHRAHLNKLLEFIESGQKEGATLVHGGNKVDRPGYFLEPTIFTDVEDGSSMAIEESFGPIMIVSKFDGDVDDVLERANATEFGLASGVFTKDISKALKVSDGLDAGTVYVNTYNKTDVASAFGGFKQSGFGKDLGMDAITEWTKIKTVTVEY